jgi:hypothetical protein
LSRAITVVGADPAEVVPEAFSVVVYINGADNPGAALFDDSGAAIVRFNDLVTQLDAVPSQLNGRTALVEVIRVYDGDLQLNVRVGTS